MITKNLYGVLFAAVVVTGVMPATAHADIYVVPFAGITFGGDTTKPKPVYGASVALMRRSCGCGLEVEAGVAPSFLENGGAKTRITTLSASYIAGGDVLGRGWKPYGLVGLTLLRSRIENLPDGSENDLALNLAAGISTLFNRRVGLRSEIRYFRRGVKPIPS